MNEFMTAIRSHSEWEPSYVSDGQFTIQIHFIAGTWVKGITQTWQPF